LEEKGISASETFSNEQLLNLMKENNVVCPNCGKSN
jgi:hypothetical protein